MIYVVTSQKLVGVISLLPVDAIAKTCVRVGGIWRLEYEV